MQQNSEPRNDKQQGPAWARPAKSSVICSLVVPGWDLNEFMTCVISGTSRKRSEGLQNY